MSPFPWGPLPSDGPPLEPDADEAYGWVKDVLNQPQYARRETVLSRLWDRFMDWLTDLRDSASNIAPDTWVTIAVGIFVVAIVAVLFFAGPLRRERRVQTGGMMGEDDRPAEQIREEADKLAGQGEWAQAAIQRFRAVVRSLSERVLIQETPGMTAHEAAHQATDRLPDLTSELVQGADRFDALAYGGRPGSREWYDAMVALDRFVAAAKPVRLAAVADEAVKEGGTRVTVTPAERAEAGAEAGLALVGAGAAPGQAAPGVAARGSDG
jgi:hypothetical protein